MTYEIDTVEVQPVAIARVVRRGRLDQIGEVVMPAFDLVWSTLHGTGARTGHNVIVYNGTGSDAFDMEVGVQVTGAIELPPGEVALGQTPGGRAVHTLHVGPYDRLRGAFDALHQYAAREHLALGTAAWEVYGDWNDDPAKLTTDVYILLG
jgi:effector-binding domain-containing protein